MFCESGCKQCDSGVHFCLHASGIVIMLYHNCNHNNRNGVIVVEDNCHFLHPPWQVFKGWDSAV